MAPFLLTILLIAIGWYFIVRPQQVRLREQREMVMSLKVGDRVITAGGFHGTLVEVHEETVVIRLAAGVEATLARPAISRRLDPEPSEADTEPGTDHPELGDGPDMGDTDPSADDSGAGR